MNTQQLAAMGGRLNAINPGAATGNCEACAIHTAMILITGGFPMPVGNVGNWQISTYRNAATSFEEGEDRADEAWTWINTHAVPGGVYLLDDEDHSLNILRDYGGRLFLIDSNMQIYRRVQSAADCTVQLPDGSAFNHLGPGEGSLDITFFGLLHRAWGN